MSDGKNGEIGAVASGSSDDVDAIAIAMSLFIIVLSSTLIGTVVSALATSMQALAHTCARVQALHVCPFLSFPFLSFLFISFRFASLRFLSFSFRFFASFASIWVFYIHCTPLFSTANSIAMCYTTAFAFNFNESLCLFVSCIT